MTTLPHISVFIACIHMNCFLTFQYEITLYNLHPHVLFLNFLYEIIILHFVPHIFFYSLHPYEFFLNILMWNNYNLYPH